MEQSIKVVARNLKQIREERNLSFDKLSDLTGVSKSMLRQIEIGQSNPTIATIWKIANGLKIPFTTLLRDQPHDIFVHSFKDYAPLLNNIPGYRLFPLISFSPEYGFEVYYVEIDPGTELDADPHEGNAEEYIFVIQGVITITAGNITFDIKSSSYVRFQANCSHRYVNTGDALSSAVMLISYHS